MSVANFMDPVTGNLRLEDPFADVITCNVINCSTAKLIGSAGTVALSLGSSNEILAGTGRLLLDSTVMPPIGFQTSPPLVATVNLVDTAAMAITTTSMKVTKVGNLYRLSGKLQCSGK